MKAAVLSNPAQERVGQRLVASPLNRGLKALYFGSKIKLLSGKAVAAKDGGLRKQPWPVSSRTVRILSNTELG
jgi:hypothetical protein